MGCSDAGVFFIFISSVIVILFVLRKRYQKDSLAHMKNSGEIHEQLVTYDEEGGGEMDTNGYDAADGFYTFFFFFLQILNGLRFTICLTAGGNK